MAEVTRREFMYKAGGASAALAYMAANGIKLNANPLGMPIGTQMWPHQTLINNTYEGFEKVCKDLKAVGVDTFEAISPSGPFDKLTDGKRLRKIADSAGLKCLSAHFRGLSEPKNMPALFTFAHDLGMTHMSTHSLVGATYNGGTTTLEDIKKTCDYYNKLGAQVKKEGLQLMTHNEGFENSRIIDGRLTYPVLLEYLDPEMVKMQFQMSSMTTIGDPIMYFKAYPGRFASAHLQGVTTTNGMRAAQPGGLTVKREGGAGGGRGGGGAAGGGRAGGGGAPAAGAAPAAGGGAGAASAPGAAPAAAGAAAPAAAGRAGGGGGGGLAVGEDTVDWVAVFTAAKTGGLKNFFVEQNWDTMVRSVAFLKTLNVT